MVPMIPSVCRKAKRHTAHNVSAVATASSE